MTDIYEWLEVNGPPIPKFINGVCVNMAPLWMEITEIIDHRRIGPNRHTFYLAKDANGKYYWFHPPRTDRDRRLSELIGNYRHRLQVEPPEG